MERNNYYDLDGIMVISIHSGKGKGVIPNNLYKIWRIYVDKSKRTLYIPSHNNVRKVGPNLSRNYGTNDRMFQYKHLKEHLFIDTLFETKEANK